MFLKVLIRSTKYYRVVLQFISVLLCTKKNCKVLLRTTEHYFVLKSINPGRLIFVTHKTSSTISGAPGVILQLQQILRLPQKMTLIINLRHMYNARSIRTHPRPFHEILSSKLECKLPKLLPPKERWFDDHRSMIGAGSEGKIVISHLLLRRSYLSHLGDPKTSRKAAPTMKSDNATSPNIAPATKDKSHN